MSMTSSTLSVGMPFMILCRLLTFSKLTFSKKSFMNIIRVSNSLDTDQARRSLGPDLGANWLQRLSADDKLKRNTNYSFFHDFLSSADFFFKVNFFEKIFQKYNQRVKQFESRAGPTEHQAWSG